MSILKGQNWLLTGIFITALSYSAMSQTGQVNVQQSEVIPQLLEAKSDMTRKGRLGERYNIQIFNGDNSAASEVLRQVRATYTNLPSDIVYETPNYKVLLGNFRNKLEADRALLKIKQDFPSAFIPKPRRG